MGASRVISACFFVMVLAVACRNPSVTRVHDDAALRELGSGFVTERIPVNGTTLHYVRGGSGPAVILVHGFPEDWSAWHRILPHLSRRFEVVAVDLRGIGASAPAKSGFDAATMAQDIHQLTQHLGMRKLVIVGHDIGGMVAYAFGRLHPEATRGVLFIESLAPGIDPWDEIEKDPAMWHFGFLQTEPLAEQLLIGREAIFIREFMKGAVADVSAIDDAQVDRYARAYAGADRLRAGVGFYRAFPETERFNAEHRSPTEVPLVVVASEKGFASLLPKMVEGFRAHGWRNVTTEVVANSVHYVLDEQPEAVARLIERHTLAWERE
jgi:pimeloyl-ACP methyl ester carboxylesterase